MVTFHTNHGDIVIKTFDDNGDVWMAWSLLEAGRLWKEQRYTDIGSALLKRIAREEVVTVPGLGSMLLPGKVY